MAPTPSSTRVCLLAAALLVGCGGGERVDPDPAGLTVITPLSAQLVRVSEAGLSSAAVHVPRGTGGVAFSNDTRDRLISVLLPDTAHDPLRCAYVRGFVADGSATFTSEPLAPGAVATLCFHAQGSVAFEVHGVEEEPLRGRIEVGDERPLALPGVAAVAGSDPLEEAPEPPALVSVDVRVSSVQGGDVVTSGDTLQVDVVADAGLQVEVELGEGRRHPLVEESPGTYRLRYTVVMGDHVKPPLTVHARDAHGQTATRVVRDPAVAIDARPPGVPRKLALKRGGRKLMLNKAIETVVLSWEEGEGTPAVGYRVYGLSGLGVPSLLTKSSVPTVTVHAGKHRYAVAGLDARGNLGQPALVEAARAE